MYSDIIISDPNIMMGKPIIKGTRITVEYILEEHPNLTREAIKAALAFAADVLKDEVVYPISGNTG